MKNTNFTRLLAVMVIVFVIFSIVSPAMFLSVGNFKSMGMQVAELGFFSCAMMLSFLSGGIDLSIVAISNMTCVTCSFIMLWAKDRALGDNAVMGLLVLCFVIAAAMGVALGAFNGLLISAVKLPPLLATLGTMNLYSGITMIITRGKTISGFPEVITSFGNGYIGIVAIPLIMLVVLIAVMAVVLNRTRYGMRLRFYGTNAKASLFSGIRNNQIVMRTYMFVGLISGVAGIEVMSRTNSAKVEFGSSYLFTSILCIVLGGVSPNGGVGTVSGLVLSLIIMQFLSSGFSILHVDSVLRNFIWGIMLLSIMVINDYLEKRKLTQKIQ